MIGKAKYLAAASVLEYVVQLAVPVLLVRLLTGDDFASYRFIGLATATVFSTLMLGVPISLYYFVPRHEPPAQAAYMLQSAALCLALGLFWTLVAAAVDGLAPGSAFSRLIPADVKLLFYVYLAAVTGSAALDTVAAAKGDIEGQAVMKVIGALVRVAALLAGAWLAGLVGVLVGLCVYALLRWILFGAYVARLGARPRYARGAVREQVLYTLPFGIANGLFVLRQQAEQWVGASLLPKPDYVALSVAATVIPLAMFMSRSITASITAEMNRLEAAGRHREMLRLNADANLVRVVVVFPAVAVLASNARPLLSLIYTPAYAHGDIVVQLLFVGVVGCIVEVSTLARALRLGRWQLGFDAVMLVLSLALSVSLTLWIGLVGTVAGSVVGLWLGTAWGTAVLLRKMSIRLREFQHWGAIVRCLLALAAATALGLLLEHAITRNWPAPLALALGAAVTGGAYLLLARSLGISTLKPLSNIPQDGAIHP